jgi:tight adherence protein B
MIESGLVLFFGFVSVALFAWTAVALFGEGVRRYEHLYRQGAERHLEAAWLSIPPQQVVYLSWLCALAVYLLFLLVFAHPWIGLPFALSGLLLPQWGLWWLKRRRDARFGLQLVDALDHLSNALRAGLSLPQAIELIVREMDPPIRQEFGLVVQEMRLGVPMPEALANLLKRMPGDDLDLVVTAVAMAQEVGGNLTEVFDRLAATIRERHRVEGRIRALSAMGRMQGVVMGVLPVALGCFLYFFQPGYFAPMVSTLWGWMLILGIVLWEGLGAFFVWRTVSIDV